MLLKKEEEEEKKSIECVGNHQIPASNVGKESWSKPQSQNQGGKSYI